MKKGILGCLFFALWILTGCGQADETQQDNGLKVNAAETAMSEQPTPTLDLIVEMMDGRAKVLLITGNFRFAPDKTNQKPVFGEGHAHLWLNGQVKHTTITEEEVVLNHLPPGEHKLSIALHHNNHSPYEVEKTVIFTIK
jgi:hypothetical protein